MLQIQTIILAAGHGKRMKSDLPKVLIPLKGVPLIVRLITAVKKSSVGRPVIVVGQGSDHIKKTLGGEFSYIFQKEQLGTGHAVLSAKPHLFGKSENVMVLYGDHPLVSEKTIDLIAETHKNSGAALTMATVKVPDFLEWRENFYDYGRIIRNKNGTLERIVERKDASPEERNITEVNPSYFCFNAEWLWDSLEKINNDNAQKEYYLTDLPKMAVKSGKKIMTVPIEAYEALGANTPEQLDLLEKLLDSQLNSKFAARAEELI